MAKKKNKKIWVCLIYVGGGGKYKSVGYSVSHTVGMYCNVIDPHKKLYECKRCSAVFSNPKKFNCYYADVNPNFVYQ